MVYKRNWMKCKGYDSVFIIKAAFSSLSASYAVVATLFRAW